MKLSPSAKGYIFTFLSILTLSNVYVFSKAVMNRVAYPQFGFWWFLTGGIYITLYGIITRSFRVYKDFGRKEYAVLLVNGLLELGGTYFFFKAIQTVSNPSIVSFLWNMAPVFVVVLGALLLHERFNVREAAGILITLTGAFLISYKGGRTWNDMFIDGSQYVLISIAFFSFNSILLKKYVKHLSPLVLTINRVIFLTSFFFIFLLLSPYSFRIPYDAMKNVWIGAFLGPFLTVILSLHALKYIDVSKKSVLGTTKGLFVMLLSYLMFKNLPSALQITGGILAIIGSVLIITGRTALKKRKVA